MSTEENKDQTIAELRQRIADLEAHLGPDATWERISESHTEQTVEASMDKHGLRHLPYSQDRDKGCYICSLLAKVRDQEEEMSLLKLKPDYRVAFEAEQRKFHLETMRTDQLITFLKAWLYRYGSANEELTQATIGMLQHPMGTPFPIPEGVQAMANKI